MKKLINVNLGGGVVALLACLFVSSAGAQSATLSCPNSVKEGGLVAHAALDCGNTYAEYCEYRDKVTRNTTDGRTVKAPAPGQVKSGSVTFHTTTAAAIDFIMGFDGGNRRINVATNKSGEGAPPVRPHVAEAYSSMRIELYFFGEADWVPGNNTTETYAVWKTDGTLLDSCTIAVDDDDNTAYVGSRRSHPYGGTWEGQPHCVDTVKCAFD